MVDLLNIIGYQGWVVPVLLLLPVAGALLIVAAPTSRARSIALAVTLVEFLVSAGLWWAFVPGGGMQFAATIQWMPLWGIAYRVGIDGISLFMVLLSTLMMQLCVLGSWNYITERERGFYALLLVLLTGMLGVFISTRHCSCSTCSGRSC